MNIYSISDLHLSLCGAKPMDIFGASWENYLDKIKEDWQKKVSDNDIVLLAGDLSWAMKLDDVLIDIEYLNQLNGTKIIIKGNHDYWWSSYSALKEKFPNNIIAIQNNAVKIGKYVICGTRGWTVPEQNATQSEEDKKIYKRELIRMDLSLKSAKALLENDDKLIVMIHYPPFNSKIDDSDFTKMFESYNVNKVVFGHLHGKKSRLKNTFNKNGIEYILTSCDLVDNKLTKIY